MAITKKHMWHSLHLTDFNISLHIKMSSLIKKWTIQNLSQRRVSISIKCCHGNHTLQHSSCLLPYRSQSLTVSTPWSKEFNKNNSIWIQNLPWTLISAIKTTAISQRHKYLSTCPDGFQEQRYKILRFYTILIWKKWQIQWDQEMGH